ncbi:hypothetical protein LJ739_03360 [Aestuariibacter halophilus]|uniref:Catalase n=1 Tax=Fluctibacter halophilus TaxID=226011 RepID=A0ABS8G589_9ALTE|nr:hypothetical protein [Aestuariibacter halophilus]MCC2615276.1 hypothetical protein [Aestuariibacter halophilus]
MSLPKRLLVAGIIITALVLLLLSNQAHGQSAEDRQRDPSLRGDEEALARQMTEWIIKVSEKRHPSGIVRRFNQVKSLGCFDAEFIVSASPPDALRHGIFATGGRYPAVVRFANASTLDDRDKDLRGLSIRVSNVPGQPIWGEPGHQDFVLNSHPVLFADSPETFLAFIKAQYEDSLLGFFLNPFDSHLGALMILLRARDHHDSPFNIDYHSTTAYALGDQQAVKYRVTPCSTFSPPPADTDNQNYLRAVMQQHLEQQAVCFDFQVQRQTDPEQMPLDDPSVAWDTAVSEPITVARLRIEPQTFSTREALAHCEAMSFNPWQSLQAHRPLGRMNYVRQAVYRKLSAYRHRVNDTRGGADWPTQQGATHEPGG